MGGGVMRMIFVVEVRGFESSSLTQERMFFSKSGKET